jgi:hypothetical protein
MQFTLADAFEILGRTPKVIRTWIEGLPDSWILGTEGPDTWSAFEVVGHLIHGERTDWIPRARLILELGDQRAFVPFDRFAHLREFAGRPLPQLIELFTVLRSSNLDALRDLHLTDADLERRGRHPELGPVTMRELLATWVVHDLNHIAQIARVMATQYADEVGPWRAYLPVLNRLPVVER